MKIEVDIPDDRIEGVIRSAITNTYNWTNQVSQLAELEAKKILANMAISSIVSKYIDEKLPQVISDVVYRQTHHVVKLAVDRELAVARERIKAELEAANGKV